MELAAQGLRRRAKLDQVGGDEGHFLDVLRRIAETGVTPAEEKLEAYRKRMGWRFNFASSYGSDFNRDFHVSFTKDELAKGMSRHLLERMGKGTRKEDS